MNKKLIILASAAAIALSASVASAQIVRRDHRTTVVPARRGASLVVNSFGPTSGRAGTTVTVYGENFHAGTTVLYGGRQIAPSTLTRTRLTFVVPAFVGDSSIALSVPNMRRPIAVGSFDVIVPRPSPPIISRPAPLPFPSYEQSYEQQWSRTRYERRNKRWQGLNAQYDRRFLSRPAVKAEFELHAQRTARLERMKRIAMNSRNNRLVSRINIAIRKENQRHELALASLTRNPYFG